MSRRRRYGDIFTDSLEHFHKNTTDLNCAVIQSESQDSLEMSNSQNTKCLSHCIYKDSLESSKSMNSNESSSVILAGNLAEKFSSSISPCKKKNESYYLHSKKHSIDKENNDLNGRVEPLMSPLKNKIYDKRDTNYNYNVQNTEEKTESEENWLLNALSSLCDDKIIPNEVSAPNKVLRRVSEMFVQSPRAFTDKLLTILEESFVTNTETHCESAISLRRLTTEFRKMCKFIEDESIPEWAPSLMLDSPSIMSPFTTPKKKQEYMNNSVNNRVSDSQSYYLTPLRVPDKKQNCVKQIYRKTPNSILKVQTNKLESPNMVYRFDDTFESLEAECNRIYDNRNSERLYRCKSTPNITNFNMSHYNQICDKQMALLNSDDDDSSIIDRRRRDRRLSQNNQENKRHSLKTIYRYKCLSNPSLRQIGNKFENVEYFNGTDNYENYQKDTSVINEKNDESSDSISDFEKSFFQEMAEKRRRCLDTAKIMMEITSDSEAPEVKKLLNLCTDFTNHNEEKEIAESSTFLKTLMSCEKYHQFLMEKQKILLEAEKLRKSGKYSNSKKCANKNLVSNCKSKSPKMSVSNYGSSVPCVKHALVKLSKTPTTSNSLKNSASIKNNTQLFLTPNKNLQQNVGRKKPSNYFKDPNRKSTEAGNSIPKRRLANELKVSPYSINYKKIVSPVALYIQGKSTQLLKNSPGKMSK